MYVSSKKKHVKSTLPIENNQTKIPKFLKVKKLQAKDIFILQLFIKKILYMDLKRFTLLIVIW